MRAYAWQCNILPFLLVCQCVPMCANVCQRVRTQRLTKRALRTGNQHYEVIRYDNTQNSYDGLSRLTREG